MMGFYFVAFHAKKYKKQLKKPMIIHVEPIGPKLLIDSKDLAIIGQKYFLMQCVY